MEIGIDSFAAMFSSMPQQPLSDQDAVEQLLARMKFADEVGIDVFGIGEHHRKGFLDSAPFELLSAAAAITKKIRLTTAVTVLSSADPVRVFQSYATLDLISKGRAEMVVGRGSFIDAYPLFGLQLEDYDDLFVEKLDLLMKIMQSEEITWRGRFRPALQQQAIYPRPVQDPAPVWIGVGGTPESFVRAGTLGLPLMVAIIGGETHHFKPLVDLYREAGKRAGHSPDRLKVGMHSLGYVAETRDQAMEEFYPGYAEAMNKIGRERGWSPMTRSRFEAQLGPRGALLVGDPEEVAEKIIRHSTALGGLSRLTFQMDTAELTHEKLLNAIKLIATRVKPLVNLSE
jgi:probable LLM family oxidoreductase